MTRLMSICLLLLLCARVVSAQDDITGWWSGTVTEHFFWDTNSPGPCANGTPAPFSTSSTLVLAISQNGPDFAGSMTLQHRWSDHRNPDNGQCMWIDRGSFSFAVSGTVSGSAIIMEPIDPSFSSTLSVAGSVINGSFQADTESASFILARESANLPAQGDITGWWSGIVTEHFSWDTSSPAHCANGTPASFSISSPLVLAIAQNGPNFAGSMTLQHRWSDHRDPDTGHCTWIDRGSFSFAVSGTVSGSAIMMEPIDPSFSSTLSVAGSVIHGTFQGDTESASFILFKRGFVPSRRRAVRH
jgi:hypothetical protein